MLNAHILQIVTDKMGVEIGGPSPTAGLLYQHARNMDNVIFSNKTIWSTHSDEYLYYPNKKGKVILNDVVDMHLVSNDAYDFLFSSHSLEHVANPLKAIHESLRVVKKDGYLILILPEKSLCFDHSRDYSSFSTLLIPWRTQ